MKFLVKYYTKIIDWIYLYLIIVSFLISFNRDTIYQFCRSTVKQARKTNVKQAETKEERSSIELPCLISLAPFYYGKSIITRDGGLVSLVRGIREAVTISLPWKLNHRFTKKGCSSCDRISTSRATFFNAPLAAHSPLWTYFIAYIFPVRSRFCTMHTYSEIINCSLPDER